MGAELRTPTERTCELCGRREVWEEGVGRWAVDRVDGDPVVGNVFCLHEWDINGTFVPVEKSE